MKKYLIAAVLFFAACSSVSAQQPLKEIRKKSWQSLVYRIPADTAEKHTQKTISPPDHYLGQQPFLVAPADSLDHDELPLGNYLILSVVDNELAAEFFCRSNLQVFPLNNRNRVQLEVKDEKGNYLSHAEVWVNKKLIPYDAVSQGYWITHKKPEEAILKIAVPGDTLLMQLWGNEEMEQGAWSQWWKNFGYTRTGRILTWPVRSVKTLVTQPASRWFRKKRKYYGNSGYMIFSKPKYLPRDTVKFKAYLLTSKGKQYKKAADVFLEYYDGGRISNRLAMVQPASPGAFVYEFALGDSLDSDRQYTIAFKTRKKKQPLLNRVFRVEDYVLDEVASYSLRSQQESYFRKDTMVFYASAKDANGLPVMDGRVNLYVLTANINKFYKDREFVPDTLWKGEKALAVDGDTRFEIPATGFPAADLSLNVLAEFRNSNNELQEKKEEVQFLHQQSAIKVQQANGWIRAEYLEDGRSVSRKGWLEKPNLAQPVPVVFPYTEKIDPYAKDYDFSIKNEQGKIVTEEQYEPDDYQLSFSRIQQKDTTGFFLYNPNRVPVHYTIFFGNTIIAKGGDSTEWVSWKKVLSASRSYRLEWHYIWAGEEKTGGQNLAVLDKILETKITGAATIYPGQTDTITVAVKDYKGRPAAGVNLTAVSYNNQFGADIRVPEPPYIKRYRSRRRIVRDTYELDDAGFSRKFPLGEHQQWIQTFSLDTMVYYRFLFPPAGTYRASTPIREFMPQLAAHVVQKGVPQEIYLLYINRELVYYNGVTDKSNYAYTAPPGYVQVGIRLRDRYIEIDSIYLQPFYKLDLGFDIDHLPSNAVVKEMPGTYTSTERQLLERTIWQLENDGRTNYSYVWQRDRLVFLNSSRPHLVGPFSTYDSLQFFKPRDFDFRFPFESGYQYRLTPKMARLERKVIFPYDDDAKLPVIKKSAWILGDTIVAPPEIAYPRPILRPYLKANDYEFTNGKGAGKLKIEIPRDSSFSYGVLYRADTARPWIKNYGFENFYRLQADSYNLILVTGYFNYLVANKIDIKEKGTTCVRMVPPVYTDTNAYIQVVLKGYEKERERQLQAELEKEKQWQQLIPTEQRVPIPAGTAGIIGRVTDKKGKEPIVGATIYIKGTTMGVTTDVAGNFSIRNIKAGKYVLVVNYVGYESKEIRVDADERASVQVDVQLVLSEKALEEVVVTAYGIQQKKSLAGSVSIVRGEELTNALQGRVAGVTITSATGYYADSSRIRIRGTTSISADSRPLLVINGVPMDEMPADLDMDKAQINVLKDAAATAIYGSRAANGVIIITTADFIPKQLRDKFRDYAFWQPNLLTDEKGIAKFTVTYPDNITGWQTYVVGMDKRRRITRATTAVKSFKPLLAQLSTPQFLVEGDSAVFIGKTINYTTDAFSVQTDFSVNDGKKGSVNKQIAGKASDVEELWVSPGSADTLSTQYTVTAATGYSDGELRRIPVVRKGIEETIGNFWILDRDTTVSFQPDPAASTITIHAQNNTLDVLLDEIDHLKQYPYYCMEQTASKLTGLILEKKIRTALKQPFRNEKELQRLLSKLQKAQLYEGGWSWWEGGEVNLAITNYVTQALLVLRDNPLVETNIRNALLYLQNRLPYLRRDAMLAALFTLSEAGHLMDYNYYVARLPFDSLTLHQQWQVVKIKQAQQLDYAAELRKLMEKKTETMLGGLHWGDDSYWWDRNRMATTVLAFRVLGKEGTYGNELKQITQFFLEQRKKGHWMNTVESASILNAILPGILQNNTSFTSPAVLKVNAGVTTTVQKFPFTTKLPVTGSGITLQKTGGGMVYATAYQQLFNKDPQPVTDKFRISTWFERSGNDIVALKAGEKIVLKIKLEVLKDAEYVQMEIPIPAGCTYGEKKQTWNMHREFLKDKAVFFIEKLDKGTYSYEIELEPRYTGTYTLNPARAELMYFPVFYGRNEMKQVKISK